LHLANVVMADERNGAHYVCVVNNKELRNIVEGDDQKIIPSQVTGDDHRDLTLTRSCDRPYSVTVEHRFQRVG